MKNVGKHSYTIVKSPFQSDLNHPQGSVFHTAQRENSGFLFEITK